MSMTTKSRGYRKTKTYKDIKNILKNKFETPSYTDNTEYGVSFKWFVQNLFPHNLSESHLKSIFPKEHYDRLTFKFLDSTGKVIQDKPFDWLEKIFGRQYNPVPVVFRILVDLRGAK